MQAWSKIARVASGASVGARGASLAGGSSALGAG